MECWNDRVRVNKGFALTLTLLLVLAQVQIVDAKLDCGPTVNKSSELPRTIAIGTNPAGTGAHAIASGLAAIASKTTQVSAKVQPYNGPNAWMPLLESGEIEFGIINILDSHMAATGTGNYKKSLSRRARRRRRRVSVHRGTHCPR